MDELDKEIIMQLQNAGRLSYVALAKSLQVSERTARNRVKNLLSNGIIKITAVPNLGGLGYNFIGIVALQVRLADLRTVAAELTKHSNVCYLANVTGRYEFIAIVVTQSPRQFADFVENVMSTIPGILRTETFVNLNIYKGQGNGLDTGQLIGDLEVSLPKKL